MTSTSPQNDEPRLGSPTRTERLKKQLHDDMEALEHRISKLKIEEFRTQAAVKALDRQMDIVETRKAQHQREVERRERLREKREREQEEHRESIASARRKMRDSVAEALARSLEAKKESVDEQRRLRMLYQCEKSIHEANEQEKILSKHDSVRETDTRVKTKQVRQAARRIEIIREQERKEVERDAAERDEKISKLKKLEREERKIRDRLDKVRRIRDQKAAQLMTVEGSRPSTRQATPRSTSQRSGNATSLPPL
jgi:hypothetical protein